MRLPAVQALHSRHPKHPNLPIELRKRGQLRLPNVFRARETVTHFLLSYLHRRDGLTEVSAEDLAFHAIQNRQSGVEGCKGSSALRLC